MPEIKVPARVLALAASIGDEPIAWSPTREDGSITIVFCNKGKLTFYPDPISEPDDFPEVIHTKAEAEEVVKTLTPKHETKPKKKGA